MIKNLNKVNCCYTCNTKFWRFTKNFKFESNLGSACNIIVLSDAKFKYQ